MAYPIIPAPYGLKPVSLIGGQVFSGSTRLLPIQYNYGINIFYGDMVSLDKGYVQRMAVTTGATAPTGAPSNGQVGVFLGVSYTNPVTKQKTFNQYWPANTLAGDAMAVVTDDPDTVFKAVAVAVQGTTTVASFNTATIGLNVVASDLAGNINTGDSYVGVLAASGAATAAYPLRVVDLVRDTAQATTATLVSGGGTATLTVSATTVAIPLGAEVGYLAPNGQYIGTGAWVSAAAPAGSTTISLSSQAATVNAGGTASTPITIPASSTMVFTQYPEALLKLNFGFHSYYNNTAVIL
jgi:hypothetical protein